MPCSQGCVNWTAWPQIASNQSYFSDLKTGQLPRLLLFALNYLAHLVQMPRWNSFFHPPQGEMWCIGTGVGCKTNGISERVSEIKLERGLNLASFQQAYP